MVNLPDLLHTRLRDAADAADAAKGDIVLEALDEHGDTLLAELGQNLRRRSLRRRHVPTATQCELYLTVDERDEIDRHAADAGLSRSALVTKLLEAHLGAV